MRRDREVVVVGSVNSDFVVRVGRRPEPGETVADGVFEEHAGGKGANQAVAAALCGARVRLVARVGDDRAGDARVKEIVAGGVNARSVEAVPGATTGVAFITVTPDGQNSIVVAPGANGRLRPGDLSEAAAAIGAASVLLVQLELSVETVERAVELAGPGTCVVLNVSPARKLAPGLLARTDVLVANEVEAEGLCGIDVVDREGARRAAREVRAMGPRAVVITLGEGGAVAIGPEIEVDVRAPKVRVVDTTGAGDALVGGLAACLAAGKGLEEAVRFGVAVGSATTEAMGAYPRLPLGPA